MATHRSQTLDADTAELGRPGVRPPRPPCLRVAMWSLGIDGEVDVDTEHAAPAPPSSPSWVTSTTARPACSTRLRSTDIAARGGRRHHAAHRRLHRWSSRKAEQRHHLHRHARATRPSPQCVVTRRQRHRHRGARRRRPMTASCRRPSRPSSHAKAVRRPDHCRHQQDGQAGLRSRVASARNSSSHEIVVEDIGRRHPGRGGLRHQAHRPRQARPRRSCSRPRFLDSAR